MNKLLDNSILVCEDCVSYCLSHSSSKMNKCIQQCIAHERICKALKVCIKNQCNKDVLMCLMKSCLMSGKCVVEECGKHNMQCCKKCVTVVGKLNTALKSKGKSSSKKTKKK